MRTLLAVGVALALAVPVSSQEPGDEWRTIASWEGQGIQSTESFEIESREWRIRWETSNEAFTDAGVFQIFVHRPENDLLVDLAANQQGTGSATSYVRADPGRFYLQMNSANIDWEVAVQVRR